MGDYSSICELRGRAREGRGCSRISGLAYCAKKGGGLSTSANDDCTSLDVDALVDANVQLKQVFSGCRPARAVMTAGAGRWQRTRSPLLYARDYVAKPRFGFSNMRVSGNNESSPGAGTICAWFEYPQGVFTMADQCIAAAGNTPAFHVPWPALTTVELDFGVPVDKNTAGRVVVIQANDNGTVFFQPQAADNLDSGIGWESGTSNMPTTPGGMAPNVITYMPLYGLGFTRNPAIGVFGDSREEAGTEGPPDGNGEAGMVRPSLGPYFGIINFAESAQTLNGFLLGSKSLRMDALKYVDNIINMFGINDLGTGRTALQLQDDMIAFARLFPGKKVFGSTLPPYVGTSDGFLTLANETNITTGNNAKVTAYNAMVRAGITGLTGYFDIAGVFDPTRSGRYPVGSNVLDATWSNSCVFTGSIAPGVLTVTAVTSGSLNVGDPIVGALNGTNPFDPDPGNRIERQLTGTPGGVGTYALSRKIDTVSSRTLYVGAYWTNDGLHWTDIGRNAIVASGVVDPNRFL